jgi:hypothetical protein
VEGPLHDLLGRLTSLRLIHSYAGHLKEHEYAASPTSIKDFAASLHAAVTTVDAGMLRRVQKNTMRSNIVCLLMHGARFERVLQV